MSEHKETTIREVETTIRECRQHDIDARFYGYPAFAYLWKENRLPPFKIDAIRVFQYGSIIDPHYFTTKDGRLELIVGEDDTRPVTIHDPKELLSLENAPDGWEPTGRYWCWEKKRLVPF